MIYTPVYDYAFSFYFAFVEMLTDFDGAMLSIVGTRLGSGDDKIRMSDPIPDLSGILENKQNDDEENAIREAGRIARVNAAAAPRSDPVGIYDADLNGDLWVLGGAGEQELDTAAYHVLFIIDNTPLTNPEDRNYRGGLAGWATRDVQRFLLVNYVHLREHNIEHENATKLAYLRLMASTLKLISPTYDPADWDVKYNDARFVSWDGDYLQRTENLAANVNDDVKIAMEDYYLGLAPDTRREIRLQFTNMVCLMAYMFRIRGHHWLDDYEDRVEDLWMKCLYKPRSNMIPFDLAFTVGLHAIIPKILDTFWLDSVKNNRCAGTLIKRVNAAPAGSAAIHAISQGIRDIKVAFPSLTDYLRDEVKELTAHLSRIESNRWIGSINAKYYGQTYELFDEHHVSVLAAAVKTIYENLAEDSPLKDSPAIKRVANQSPVTGKVVALAAQRGIKREEFYLLPLSDSIEE